MPKTEITVPQAWGSKEKECIRYRRGLSGRGYSPTGKYKDLKLGMGMSQGHQRLSPPTPVCLAYILLTKMIKQEA